MKKFLKKLKIVLAVGMAATLSSIPASASEASDEAQAECGGAYMYNVATGETTYIPPKEADSLPGETEGGSPMYDPYGEKASTSFFITGGET